MPAAVLIIFAGLILLKQPTRLASANPAKADKDKFKKYLLVILLIKFILHCLLKN
jgi:hypothetical protein